MKKTRMVLENRIAELEDRLYFKKDVNECFIVELTNMLNNDKKALSNLPNNY